MAGTLLDVPDDFDSKYLPYEPTLRQKQQANAFAKGSYFHSLSVFVNENRSILMLHGKVFRSQRKSDKPHQVHIEVNKEKKIITDAHCTCKAGVTGKCSHVLSLIIIIEDWKIAGYKDVPSLTSCTSLPQRWDKPRGVKIEPEPVSQIVISRPGNVQRKRKPIMANFIDNRKIQVKDTDIAFLKTIKDAPISYLVCDYNTTVDTPIGPQALGSGLGYHAPLMLPIEVPKVRDGCGDISFPRGEVSLPLDNVLQIKDEWIHLAVDKAECERIEKGTRQQSDNPIWFEERKKRITASNFGLVMQRKKIINDSFIKNTFDKQQFVSAPTSYGKANEKIAKQMYIKKTKNHLHDIGLVINPAFPFLGASPDGIICENSCSGLIEVKCPYSARDLTIEEACRENDFFLDKTGSTFSLKQDHRHWYQVQGQLMVTGAPFCDFVTFTRNDFAIVKIMPHTDTMKSLLEKLTSCYVDHFKPYFNQKI